VTDLAIAAGAGSGATRPRRSRIRQDGRAEQPDVRQWPAHSGSHPSARHFHPVKVEDVEPNQGPASDRQLAAAYDNGRSIAANLHQERSHRLTSMFGVGDISRMVLSLLERPSYLPAIT
jgi:hypothetical protein